MRSIIKNKKGFEMGWTEMMYLFLGLLLIVLILTPIFMKTSWGDIIKGWLPSLNTTQGEKYNEINGTDEIVPGVVLKDGVVIINADESLVEVSGWQVSYSVSDKDCWWWSPGVSYCILANWPAGPEPMEYYFKKYAFVPSGRVSLYSTKGVGDTFICDVIVSQHTLPSSCSGVFKLPIEVVTFILDSKGQFHFYKKVVSKK